MHSLGPEEFLLHRRFWSFFVFAASDTASGFWCSPPSDPSDCIIVPPRRLVERAWSEVIAARRLEGPRILPERLNQPSFVLARFFLFFFFLVRVWTHGWSAKSQEIPREVSWRWSAKSQEVPREASWRTTKTVSNMRRSHCAIEESCRWSRVGLVAWRTNSHGTQGRLELP